jgi:hypothetical protein
MSAGAQPVVFAVFGFAVFGFAVFGFGRVLRLGFAVAAVLGWTASAADTVGTGLAQVLPYAAGGSTWLLARAAMAALLAAADCLASAE